MMNEQEKKPFCLLAKDEQFKWSLLDTFICIKVGPRNYTNGCRSRKRELIVYDILSVASLVYPVK